MPSRRSASRPEHLEQRRRLAAASVQPGAQLLLPVQLGACLLLRDRAGVGADRRLEAGSRTHVRGRPPVAAVVPLDLDAGHCRAAACRRLVKRGAAPGIVDARVGVALTAGGAGLALRRAVRAVRTDGAVLTEPCPAAEPLLVTPVEPWTESLLSALVESCAPAELSPSSPVDPGASAELSLSSPVEPCASAEPLLSAPVGTGAASLLSTSVGACASPSYVSPPPCTAADEESYAFAEIDGPASVCGPASASASAGAGAGVVLGVPRNRRRCRGERRAQGCECDCGVSPATGHVASWFVCAHR